MLSLCEQDVLVQGFDIFRGLSLEDEYLDSVYDRSSEAVARSDSDATLLHNDVTNTFITPYMVATRSVAEYIHQVDIVDFAVDKMLLHSDKRTFHFVRAAVDFACTTMLRQNTAFSLMVNM